MNVIVLRANEDLETALVALCAPSSEYQQNCTLEVQVDLHHTHSFVSRSNLVCCVQC